MNKSTKITIIIKFAITLFITYLILFKRDVGSLIYHIGNFFVDGNYIFGLISLVNITLLYILTIHNLTFNNKSLKNLKYFLLFPDIILVTINLILGIYIRTIHYNMPFALAQSEFIILACGSAFVYYAMSIILTLFFSKTKDYKENVIPAELKINNNPLFFTGRIERKPYFITKFAIFIICLTILTIFNTFIKNELLIFILIPILSSIFFILNLFAANKRLHDIKWHPLLLIIWAIPFLGLTIGLPLFFIKTKQNDK